MPEIKKSRQFRIWEQALFRQSFLKGNILHRIRVEQVLNQNLKVNIRYRMQPSWPLTKEKIVTGALYATVFDEVFFHFQPNSVYINRIFGGLGYMFSPRVNLQSGLLAQWDYKITTNYEKNFWFTSLSLKL